MTENWNNFTNILLTTAVCLQFCRGPNGVWTCLDQGRAIQTCDLAQAEPTYTHMSLFTLFKKGKLKHIVSQNCDGLHLRSGIPRYALSEVHGNMFIEVSFSCKVWNFLEYTFLKSSRLPNASCLFTISLLTGLQAM